MSFKPLVQSIQAKRTLQPLTELSDKMKPSSSSKPNIKLSMGDPTADGNLVAPDCLTNAMIEAVQSRQENHYPLVAGGPEAIDAVAKYWRRFATTPERKAHIRNENIILASGGSHSIVLAMNSIANEGDNFLLPAPGFPHYDAVCGSLGYETRHYPLNSNKNWEMDFVAAEKLIDARTKAVVIINPSNPCGSNYSRAHVEQIIQFCLKHNLPLISDEIYGELIFKGETFTSVADFDTVLPRLIIGGTAKHVITPGWRLGWSILIDPSKVATEWVKGMDSLAQLHTGANSLAQAAAAKALLLTPQSYIDANCAVLETGAKVYERLLEHPELGLSFSRPRATMFVMVRIDLSVYKDIASDMEFYEKLLDEENVQVLPGCIFGVEGFFRATTSRPPEILNEAVDRIVAFCQRHLK